MKTSYWTLLMIFSRILSTKVVLRISRVVKRIFVQPLDFTAVRNFFPWFKVLSLAKTSTIEDKRKFIE